MTSTILGGSVAQPLCHSASSTSSCLLNENARNLVNPHHNVLCVSWSTQLTLSQGALKVGKRFVSFSRQDVFQRGYCLASADNVEQNSSQDAQRMRQRPEAPKVPPSVSDWKWEPSVPHQSNLQQGPYYQYNQYSPTTQGPVDPQATPPSYQSNVHQGPYYQYGQDTSTPQAPEAPLAPQAPQMPESHSQYNHYSSTPQYNQYASARQAPQAPQAPQPPQAPSQSYSSNVQQEPYHQYTPITPVRRRPYNLEAKMRMKAYRRQAMQQKLQAEYEEEQKNFQLDQSILYQKGDPGTVQGVIREINPVGYFVTLPSGREGFLAASQLGCSGGMVLLKRLYKVGEEITVRAEEIHTGGRDRLYARP